MQIRDIWCTQAFRESSLQADGLNHQQLQTRIISAFKDEFTRPGAF